MPDATDALVVLVTAPPGAAPGLAEAVVESRLAACANVLPEITSVYRWEGAVQRDREALLLIKTTAAHFQALSDLVQRLHPYDTPEVIALPVTHGATAYLEWIVASTAPGS